MRRTDTSTTPAAPASSSPAHRPTKSVADATIITPNAASRIIAMPIAGAPSSDQSVTAMASPAASKTAAFANSANRSCTSAPVR